MIAHILIVDDDKAQLELLRYNLEKQGFTTCAAENGRDAIHMVEEEHPDLVVLDWMMPEVSGIDVCYELRQRSETKMLPILMLSARGEEADLTKGLDSGADDYIVKPFSPRELVSRAKALLRRARPSLLLDELSYGDLSLNNDTHQVSCCGKNIKLGPREFKLLTIFLERPERVFSREQLLDGAWGHGVYVEDRTVDVYVSRLRNALKKVDCGEMIQAVRGAGYALRNQKKSDD